MKTLYALALAGLIGLAAPLAILTCSKPATGETCT